MELERDIKEYIESMDTFTENEIDVICNFINNETDIEKKKENTHLFLEKAEKFIIENSSKYSNEEINKMINQIINNFSTNEITRTILSEKEFNVENIMQKISTLNIDTNIEEETKDREIDKIENNINELEKKELNIITNEKYINSSVEEIDKEINELIVDRNNNWKYDYNNKLDINNLKINDNNKLINNVSSINSKIKELENIKKAKNNKYYGITTNELNNKLYELTNELNSTEYYSLKKELKELEDLFRDNYLFPGLTEKELKEKEKLKQEIDDIKSILNEKENMNKLSIKELKEELKKLENPLNVLDSLSFGDKNKQSDYKNQQERIAFLKKIIKERELIDSIKTELNNINKELKDRENNLSVDERNKLNNLNNIKNAYYNIINDTVKAYNNNEIDNIEDFVNNHKDIEIINNYENSKELKEELINEIKNKLKIDNKITKKENNRKKWMKAIAVVSKFTAGFVTGIAFSCFPGVGTITMGIAGARLGASAINFISKKNPEGKITKFIEKNKNKFTYMVENKFPGITEKTNNMRNKIKDFYDKYEVKYFLNGVAAGYLTGNLVELFTGNDVLEHGKEFFNNYSNNVSQVSPGNVTPGNVTPGNVTPGNVTPGNVSSELLSTNISDLAGQSYDLSSVPQGFTSSYSDTPVSLLTESAKNLSLDKANIVNGEEWWHFLKPDGEGYAWFKADDVRHLVEGTLKSGKSI